MVKIRLRRMGAKKRPFYRIVVADSRTARDGRFIEIVGTYDPNQDPPEIKIKRDRIEYWLGNGRAAQRHSQRPVEKPGLPGRRDVQERRKPRPPRPPARLPPRKRRKGRGRGRC